VVDGQPTRDITESAVREGTVAAGPAGVGVSRDGAVAISAARKNSR
jgi:hypothetical protein